MVSLLKIILKVLPWLIAVGLLTWMLLKDSLSFERIEGAKETYQNILLNRVEQMGKLELVRYSFQEVTEIKKGSDTYDLKLFKYKPLPDAKAVLISQGTATGCIDLSSLQAEDLTEDGDTLYIQLPLPELCYFKIDLEKSRIYDLQVTYLDEEDRKQFVQELYRVAEEEIKSAAMKTGILAQTKENAQLILKPLFEGIAGKPVVIQMPIEIPGGDLLNIEEVDPVSTDSL